MKLWEVFRFEAVYRLRRVSTWIYFGVFLALAFWMTTGMLVEDARRAGDVHVNAPIAIAGAIIFISMMGMMITAALAGDAATRDIELRTHPLFFTAPLRKEEYLGGRFLGTFVVNALLLAIVPVGLMIAPQMLDLEPDLLGPFRPAAYFQTYLFFLLPNLFVTGAILFACAALSRRSVAAYAGVMILFFAGMISEEILAERMAFATLGSLLDPFGFTVISERWAYLTAFEKNTLGVGLDGILLWNRIVWIGIGMGVLVFTFIRFRFAHSGTGDRRRQSARPRELGAPQERSTPLRVPRVAQSFDFSARALQATVIARRSLREIVVSRAFLAIVVGIVFFVVFVGEALLDDSWGAPTWPLTQLVTWLLSSFLIGIGICLISAFYAGELVWRERDAGISEIVDAAPVPVFIRFVGKFLAVALLLALLQAVLMAAGMLLQVLQGYYDFEITLYLRVLFGLRLADYLLFAAVAMLVHVLVDQKYIGHLIVLLFYVFTIFAGRLGVDHNLLVYGSDPGWVYSDLSGFGPFLAPYLWFKLYWAGWAVLFAVAANLFWVRGTERGFRRRITLARRRFTRPTASVSMAAAGLVLFSGGFVFYNTNILNEYRTDFEEAALRAEYERRYGRHEGVQQPVVTGTKLHVEIYPEEREVEVRGTYRLVNRTPGAIDSLHLFVHPDVETRPMTFDRPARTALADAALGHRIYVLQQPLKPGDSLRLHFEVLFEPGGFPNEGINTSVVKNGTYFSHTGGRNPNHRRWLPVIGYQPARELSGADARRAQGLKPRPAARPLDDEEGKRDPSGREWIDFEVVVGTAEKQIAVAPGTLRETRTEGGRRYFRYAADAPVRNAYAIFSADYEVHEDRWENPDASAEHVTIEIYHHPTHTFNLDRMVRSAKASLDYYTEHFGPYPHRHLRIVEFPRYANLAHAYPGTISYAESFGFLTRIEEGHIDRPFLVTAHEVAHQWWGYQVAPAAVEGGLVSTEALAHYSAIMVMEEVYGPKPSEAFSACSCKSTCTSERSTTSRSYA